MIHSLRNISEFLASLRAKVIPTTTKLTLRINVVLVCPLCYWPLLARLLSLTPATCRHWPALLLTLPLHRFPSLSCFIGSLPSVRFPEQLPSTNLNFNLTSFGSIQFLDLHSFPLVCTSCHKYTASKYVRHPSNSFVAPPFRSSVTGKLRRLIQTFVPFRLLHL